MLLAALAQAADDDAAHIQMTVKITAPEQVGTASSTEQNRQVRRRALPANFDTDAL